MQFEEMSPEGKKTKSKIGEWETANEKRKHQGVTKRFALDASW